VVALDERRHRRRIAALLDRLAAIERAAVEDVAEREARPSAAREEPESVTAGASRTLEPRAPAAVAEVDPRVAPRAPDSLEWLERVADRGLPAAHDERLELRAMRSVRGRLEQALTPAELADALFVSLRTLQRHLAGELACSPGELILAVKMREARRLLESGADQVQEVARRVGYDDPGHFTRRFKAYFGIAPGNLLASRSAAANARRPAA
jgi:AraC-like DNA-binding protein